MQVAAAGRDDARGHGRADSERVAHGQDRVADAQGIGIAPLDGRQLVLRIDLQHRDVVLGVGADQRRGQLLAVVELDGDLLRVVDDMVVGDDVPVRRNDEAGAERLAALGRTLVLRPLRHSGQRSERAVLTEEAAEEFIGRHRLGAALGRHRLGLQIGQHRDDRGFDGGNDIGVRHRRGRRDRRARIPCQRRKRRLHGDSQRQDRDAGQQELAAAGRDGGFVHG